MPLDLHTVLIVTSIAFIAYIIFALSGFGSNLITVPLVGHFYPLTYMLPMLALLDVTAAMRIGFQSRGHLLRGELKWLLPGTITGIIAGTTLLVNLPANLVLGILGGFIVAYGIYSLSGRQTRARLPQWVAIPAGLIGGVLSALFGTGGPIYVTYLSARGHDPLQVRSTITVFLTITAFTRVVMFVLYGLYAQQNILLYALAIAPAMLLGIYIGHRLHLNLSKRRLVQCVAVLLIASGTSLLFKALG